MGGTCASPAGTASSRRKSSEMGKKERKPVCEAVRRLRAALGDTQQQFSRRLGLAIATVVRYEHTRPPKGAALLHLERIARAQGLDKLAATFRRAFHEDMRSPLTDDFCTAPRLKRKEPQTPEDWQRAVDAAAGARALADCMMYGLVTGPTIDVARCDGLLERGAALGIRPSRSAVELAIELVHEINSEVAP